MTEQVLLVRCSSPRPSEQKAAGSSPVRGTSRQWRHPFSPGCRHWRLPDAGPGAVGHPVRSLSAAPGAPLLGRAAAYGL